MSSNNQNRERLQDEVSVGAGSHAIEEQSGLVFGSFQEAREWSKENAGRAFARCANDEGFRPVSHNEAYRASQSWHESEELYLDGPCRNQMS